MDRHSVGQWAGHPSGGYTWNAVCVQCILTVVHICTKDLYACIWFGHACFFLDSGHRPVTDGDAFASQPVFNSLVRQPWSDNLTHAMCRSHCTRWHATCIAQNLQDHTESCMTKGDLKKRLPGPGHREW